jgi:hypothetical protein
VIQQRQALGIATLTSDRLMATKRLSGFVQGMQVAGGQDASLQAEPDPSIAEQRFVEALDRVIAIDEALVAGGHVNLIREPVHLDLLTPMPSPKLDPARRHHELHQRLRGLIKLLNGVALGNLGGLHRLKCEVRHVFIDLAHATTERDRLLGPRQGSHSRREFVTCD